jgi:hypothetical protein
MVPSGYLNSSGTPVKGKNSYKITVTGLKKNEKGGLREFEYTVDDDPEQTVRTAKVTDLSLALQKAGRRGTRRVRKGRKTRRGRKQ